MLRVGWRKRPLSPAEVARGLADTLRTAGALLQVAADTARDARFDDLLERISWAVDCLTQSRSVLGRPLEVARVRHPLEDPNDPNALLPSASKHSAPLPARPAARRKGHLRKRPRNGPF